MQVVILRACWPIHWEWPSTLTCLHLLGRHCLDTSVDVSAQWSQSSDPAGPTSQRSWNCSSAYSWCPDFLRGSCPKRDHASNVLGEETVNPHCHQSRFWKATWPINKQCGIPPYLNWAQFPINSPNSLSEGNWPVVWPDLSGGLTLAQDSGGAEEGLGTWTICVWF